MIGFIERHNLWTPEQREAAQEVGQRLQTGDLSLVRLSFPDLHGILRGKALTVPAMDAAMHDGCAITSTLLLKDTSHRTVTSIFEPGAGIGMPRLQGGADVIMVPDPTTFRTLPWALDTGWMLCDLYFADGSKVPFATRHILNDALEKLSALGFKYKSGLEVEFHLTRLLDPKLAVTDSGQPGAPPQVALLHQGYNFLTEQRFDQLEPILEILRREIMALGLPLTSVEIEFGPSQVEFVFGAREGVLPADDMVLFRSATKQICRRHGYHASFMCRPHLPNVMSSGWHLHQSLLENDGNNAFASGRADSALSMTGQHFLGGLLAAAPAATAFTTPTINGYKRYRANSLAPDRVAWAQDNRGALMRVIRGLNPAATRIENRGGEPAANPYLYLASQVLSGMAGLNQSIDPGISVDAPYAEAAIFLPKDLGSALDILAQSALLKSAFGAEFINYFLMIKRAELRRFNEAVTDWEQSEYFDSL
jgi:glutamine synthetase